MESPQDFGLLVSKLIKLSFESLPLLGRSLKRWHLAMLMRRLLSADSTIRQNAMKRIAEFDHRPAIDDINSMLKDPQPEIRFEAAKTLRRLAEKARAIHSPGLPISSKGLTDNPPLNSPGGLVNKRSVDALIPALQDEIYAVRSEAALALGWLQDQRAVKPLMQACHDDRLAVQRSAIVALGFLQNAQAALLMIEIANDGESHMEIRKAAIQALGRIKDPRAIPSLDHLREIKELSGASSEALKAMAEDSVGWWLEILRAAICSPLPRFLIEIALRNRPAALDYLIVAISDEDPKVQALAAYALGSLRNDQAVPALVRALGSSSFDVQGMAAVALGEIKERGTSISLLNLLKSPALQVRFAAIYALGEIGEKVAVEPLVCCLKDPEQRLRQAAAISLAQIDPLRLRLFAEPGLVGMENSQMKSLGETVMETIV